MCNAFVVVVGTGGVGREKGQRDACWTGRAEKSRRSCGGIRSRGPGCGMIDIT